MQLYDLLGMPRVGIATYGVPASGKTTFVRPFVEAGWHHCNMDNLRAELGDNHYQNRWDIALERLARATSENLSVIADNAHVFNDQLAKLAGPMILCAYRLFILYFDVPYEMCLERNASRSRQVPLAAMDDYKYHMLGPISLLEKSPEYEGMFIIDENGKCKFTVRRG